jgi:hypothetical protein
VLPIRDIADHGADVGEAGEALGRDPETVGAPGVDDEGPAVAGEAERELEPETL